MVTMPVSKEVHNETRDAAKSLPNRSTHAFDPLTDPRWERFVSAEPRSSVFHSRGWMQALRHAYHYEPVGYTQAAPDEEFSSAMVFCRVKSWLTGQRLVSMPFSDHCEPLVNDAEDLKSLLVPAREELQRKRIKYIDIRPLSLKFSEGTANPESYFLHLLDLRPSAEELYKKLHGDSIRRKIQRAEREKLTLETGSSELLLTEFYGLHMITRQRQELPPHPISWFRNVLSCLGGNALIRIARKDGVAIAAIFTVAHKQTMVYKYGCSDANSHNLGGMQFLFWHLIRDAKDRGFVELDFGRSECENTGLVTFKDRWGTKRHQIAYLRYPSPTGVSGETSARFTKFGKRIFARCPQSVLRMAGNLLYPHVG
jgi:CelD/BcsL family acetyltransferase involved in cellulose biosynthesis